jgi:RNA polymerase sigma-70 factor, ECF subfamily
MLATRDQGQRDFTERLSRNLDGNFEELLRQYQDRLYSFALRLAGNAEDAEEVVQDAFVRAYRALQSYPPERIQDIALRPWLYQITLNVFRNRVRGRRLAEVALGDGSDYEDRDEPVGPEQERPEAAAERVELRGELAAMLANLPERYRAPVVLHYVEGLSYIELAQVLDQPVGTAKANVHRGIEQLRRHVASPAGEMR